MVNRQAVVKTGGKQYWVKTGDILTVEKLAEAPVGESLDLGEVLLVASGSEVELGRPVLAGAKVTAEVVANGKGKKIWVFKYKNKVRYRVNRGHRQQFTKVKITGIK